MKNNKRLLAPLFIVFLGIGLFFLAPSAHAETSWPAQVIGGLLGMIIGGLGVILSLVMKGLVMVAQYSQFISAPAVTNGWRLVRDLCNMFFVLILLIIAFATILHVEKYDYKKWLPKLIMMAILINFSKTICGLLIDFAQVIMLTFVNAFKGMATGNLTQAMGLTEILTLGKDTGQTVGFFEIVTAYLLGLIYVIIALVVIVTMLAMLVMRIVMMWIYIVLSPAAYLLAAFPDGKSYSEKWWKQFTENLIVGPVLAFFIWLSFASLQDPKFNQFSQYDGGTGDERDDTINVGVATTQPGNVEFTASKASTPNSFIKFVVAIGMLVGGLKITSEIGGAAGSIAGKGLTKIQNGASAVGKYAKDKAKDRAKKTGKWAGRQALYAASKPTKALGDKLQKMAPNSKIAQSMSGVGGIGLAWRQDMIDTKNKGKEKKKQEFMEKIGMGEKAMSKTDEYLKSDVGKNTSNLMQGASLGTALGMTLGGPVGAAIGGFLGTMGAVGLGLINSHTNGKADDETNLAKDDDTQANIELEKAEKIRTSKEMAKASADFDLNDKASKDFSVQADEKDKSITDAGGIDDQIKALENKANSAIVRTSPQKSADVAKEIQDKKDEKAKLETERDDLRTKSTDSGDKATEAGDKIKDMMNQINGHNTAADGFKTSADSHRTTAAGFSGGKLARATKFAMAFGSKTTQKAAANGSKSMKAARDKVEKLADPSEIDNNMVAEDGFDNSTFISASGQNPDQKKFFNELTSSSNVNSAAAIKNMETAVAGMNTSNKKGMSRVAALAKGIAAYAKNGGDVSRLNSLISALDKKNASAAKPVESVENLKSKAIVNRKTGAAGEQGSGSFDVNTFANNTGAKKEDGKDVIGVDFNKLAGTGLDVKAEASFASGDAMGPIVAALKNQISEERSKVDAEVAESRVNGTNSKEGDREFGKRYADLDKTEARLSDPEQVKDLQLVNTASANYGRQEKMTSKYHEEIHKGGLEDEDLTERTAKSLMDNKLYGRNAATKGRHASEIAKFAKEKKDQGMSNDDIMKAVDAEIKSRVASEGKSRAERVIKIMSGEKETVSQAVEDEGLEVAESKSAKVAENKSTEEIEITGREVSPKKVETPELNIDEFQSSIDKLADKFHETVSSLNSSGGASSGGSSIIGSIGKGGNENIILALKNISKAMAKNTSTLKKIGALSGGKAPSTIIEAVALNDEAGSQINDMPKL